jgi:hypothetical protein
MDWSELEKADWRLVLPTEEEWHRVTLTRFEVLRSMDCRDIMIIGDLHQIVTDVDNESSFKLVQP